MYSFNYPPVVQWNFRNYLKPFEDFLILIYFGGWNLILFLSFFLSLFLMISNFAHSCSKILFFICMSFIDCFSYNFLYKGFIYFKYWYCFHCFLFSSYIHFFLFQKSSAFFCYNFLSNFSIDYFHNIYPYFIFCNRVLLFS